MRVGVLYLCLGPMIAYKSIHLFFIVCWTLLDWAGKRVMLNLCIFHTIAYYWSVALFWALRLRLQGTANADHLFCFQCPASGDKHGPNLCCTRNLCRRVCGLGWERGCSHDGYYGMGGVGRWRERSLDVHRCSMLRNIRDMSGGRGWHVNIPWTCTHTKLRNSSCSPLRESLPKAVLFHGSGGSPNVFDHWISLVYTVFS